MTRVLLFIVLLLFNTSVNAQPELTNLSFPQQCKALDSIEGAIRIKDRSAASFSDIYQFYLKEAINSDNEELDMLIQLRSLMQAAIKREISDNRFLVRIETLIKKSKKKKWKHLTALGYDYYAWYWEHGDLKAEALQYRLKAYNEYKDLSDTLYIYKKQNLIRIGNLYLGFEDVDNALKFYHIAKGIWKEFNVGIINGIALVHFEKGNYDSALHYFNILYKDAVKIGNWVYAFLGKANAVGIYIKREQYDTAIAMLKANIQDIEKPLSKKFIAASYERMAYLYYQMGKLKEADENINIALRKFRTFNSNWYYKFIKQGYTTFKHAAEIKAALKQHVLAYSYLDSAFLVKDSLDKKFDIVKLKKIEKDLARSKLSYANQSLIYEKKQVKLQRNLYIVTVIAAASLILFILYRYRSHREKLELERDRTASELKSSKDKLSAFTQSIQDKNRLIEGFEQKLSKYEPDETSTQYFNSMSELKDATILTDEEWDDFKNIFEKVHIGFLSRLKEQYPKLTPAEVRYVVLAKLGMNTKEMASVLGVNPSSIRTLKSRLLKKMTINSEEELSQIIETV